MFTFMLNLIIIFVFIEVVSCFAGEINVGLVDVVIAFERVRFRRALLFLLFCLYQ